ncbi:ABC transporter permease [Pseudolysinimonas kribbensis]|uniref:ABC transporter permease n=1 Tax=Pseudolysinimonas kribbensis TaxID=433641 RepID=A0ABQ6K7Q5_9MICO|nr:ABC transporter permease subunit [Pseudolysinimonas kribbensis]GMA96434.1 ABC transporter permease [Pseudolysinimonas kribbensis]
MSAAAPAAPSLQGSHGVTFGGVLRSEWIKLRSLRSTFWCAVIIVVLNVALSPLLLAVLPADQLPSGTSLLSFIVSAITVGSGFTSLVAAVIGALTITGEFGTGMIRSTFTAVPKRTPALAAKAIVLTLAVFVVAVVSVALSTLIVLAQAAGRGLDVELDGAFWLALLGDAGYLALIGLMALAIGAIIRNTAGAIATMVGLILVLPNIASLVAALAKVTWLQNVGEFLPSTAGSRMYAYPASGLDDVTRQVQPGAILLEPWQGLLVLLAWIVVLGAVAIVLVRRRDA